MLNFIKKIANNANSSSVVSSSSSNNLDDSVSNNVNTINVKDSSSQKGTEKNFDNVSSNSNLNSDSLIQVKEFDVNNNQSSAVNYSNASNNNSNNQMQDDSLVNNQLFNNDNQNLASEENKKSNENNIKSLEDKSLNEKIEKIDFLTHLTQRSNKVLFLAQKKASELGDRNIDSEHLLFALLKDASIYKIFTEIGVQPQLIETELNKIFATKNSKQSVKPVPAPRLKRIFSDALVLARKSGFEFISPEHILLSLYKEGEGLGSRVLKATGVDINKLEKKVLGKTKNIEQEKKKKDSFDISQFTIDLTEKAANGLLDPVVDRSDIVERVIHILSRRRKNNPVLVGEAGVGKTALVEGLAQRIAAKEVPENLLNKRILQLDLMSVIAGASHRGEFEERMKKIIDTIVNSKGEIILFIDEIHNIVGAGAAGDSGLDASNFLKPALARGEIQVIGATTIDEYRKYIEKDPALERRFQPVLVPEPTIEQAINMLKALKDKYEAYHKVRIPDDAIEAAVVLSKRYVGGRFLPDKAVDLIDEAAAAVRLPLISLPEEMKKLEHQIAEIKQEIEETKRIKNKVRERKLLKKLQDLEDEYKLKKEEYAQAKAQSTAEVTVESIKKIISSWTGIPLSKITESETEKLLNLEDAIHKRLINQEVAVKAIAEAIRRSRAGLKSEKRPIGSFVFLGPTGVGKTELAKTLAEILFGDESALIRFDMTEYMQKHEVAKLLGAPPGYVGYEEGGKLTEAVRRRPYSVILFDEIEKAHPDVFNILLQLLDDGRLTDNKGRVVSFKNTIVICTSNIGTNIIQEELLKEGLSEVEPERLLDVYIKIKDQDVVIKKSKLFIRDQDNKWKIKELSELFSGKKIVNSKVINFPIKVDTLTFDEDFEYLSSGDLLFIRKIDSKEYNVITLADYFKNMSLVNKTEDLEVSFPTKRWKTHLMTPFGEEIISLRDKVWIRKKSEKDWIVMPLKDYFFQDDLKNISELPIEYWDVHTIVDGKEIIIVGEKVWIRTKDKSWQLDSLASLLGNYPWQNNIKDNLIIEQDVYKRIKDLVMAELGKFFRPELINRFDEVIIFEPLKYEHMREIVKLQLKELERLLSEKEIGFLYTDDAVEAIVKLGFDPVFGARPLRRAIQQHVENALSKEIIAGNIKEGDFVKLDFKDNKFVFVLEDSANLDLTQKSFNKKRIICRACNHEFETDIVSNATIVCPKCLAYGDKLEVLNFDKKENNSLQRLTNTNTNNLDNLSRENSLNDNQGLYANN